MGEHTYEGWTKGCRIRQPDRNDGAARRVAHERGRDRRLRSEVSRPAFRSRSKMGAVLMVVADVSGTTNLNLWTSGLGSYLFRAPRVT